MYSKNAHAMGRGAATTASTPLASKRMEIQNHNVMSVAPVCCVLSTTQDAKNEHMHKGDGDPGTHKTDDVV